MESQREGGDREDQWTRKVDTEQNVQDLHQYTFFRVCVPVVEYRFEKCNQFHVLFFVTCDGDDVFCVCIISRWIENWNSIDDLT